MSRVEMFVRLEDDVRQAKQATRTSSRENRKFKHWESTWDHEDRVRQGINVVFKESIHKLITWIKDKTYYQKPAPIGGDPIKHNQRWKCSFHEEKGAPNQKLSSPSRLFLINSFRLDTWKSTLISKRLRQRKPRSGLIQGLTEVMMKITMPWRKTYL